MRHLVAVLALLLMIPGLALAHEPRPGPNGGLVVDAGSYHAELVADGSDTVTLFLYDGSDQPIESAGSRGVGRTIAHGAVRGESRPASSRKPSIAIGSPE